MIKPEDLSHLKILSSPIITRNGKKVFFTLTSINVEKDRYETSIWLYDSENKRTAPLTGGVNDVNPEPFPDGERILFSSKRRDEKGAGLYYLDLRYSKEPRLVRWFEQGFRQVEASPRREQALVIVNEGKPEEDVKHIEDPMIWFNGIGYTYYLTTNLYIIDVHSGEYHRVTETKGFIRTASWSNDSRYIAYLVSPDRIRPYQAELHIYDTETGEDRVLLEKIRSYYTPRWSPDDKYIALIYHRGERGFSTHYRVHLVDTATGEEECITCQLDRNVLNTLNSDVRTTNNTRNLYWDERGNLYFLVSDRGVTKLYVYDAGESMIRELISKERFVIDAFSASADGTIALLGMTPSEPRELYLYRDGELEKITSFNKFYLSSIRLGRVEHFEVKASDGALLDAWIMYPSGKIGRDEKIPWIVYIHGGPKTSFGWSFIEEFHYLVGNGYAVVYGNPRGSDGYGEEFADIRGRYGERDYMDILEITDEAMKRYPFLDPDRIGVAGGSYGGFMTNWIITHTDKYKAAVTMRSISDWISMYMTSDIGHYFVEDQIRCTPWRNPENCIAKSPLRYVENAKTPTLIIHSDQDYRCWLDQAITMYKALKLNNVETRLVIFPGENHDLSRRGKPKHRVERLKEIREWFDKHLKKREKQER